MSTPEPSTLIRRLVTDVQDTFSFRDDSLHVGSIYTMNYDSATVALYDYDREMAGGLPKGGFLVAAKPDDDEGFILLRTLKEARLPNAPPNDQTRQHAVENTANDKPWPDALDKWMEIGLSLHGLECRVLGTFIDNGDQTWTFAEDIDNFYAVSRLMVWKPGKRTLQMIVNHKHRSNPDGLSDVAAQRVGVTRFAAASKNEQQADVYIDPTDLVRRRTAYLGMSRSGKSNAMKITASSIYLLRQSRRDLRVGQLIFDLNGEYAQDNPQDGAGIHRIHQLIGLQRGPEVQTYGLFAPPSDRDRTIMKINFYGDRFPARWDDAEVATALDQMLAGREIVTAILAGESSRYTSAFRDADLSIPEHAGAAPGMQTRYRRSVLVYQTALAAAGFQAPPWTPTIHGLFSESIIKAMRSEHNEKSPHRAQYQNASTMLGDKDKQWSWDSLQTLFDALNKFIEDKASNFKRFDDDYAAGSSSGESWTDARLTGLLRIFQTQNGPRSFQRAREQHDPRSSLDYAENVVRDLQHGKLVIVDQSTGDPDLNRKAAERIMWRVFRCQQESFRNAAMQDNSEDRMPNIIVYLEEAHNLLPRVGGADNLRTVWARSAKEGSKMNIGMVLATQAPSSIMPEILSETDNWVIAYLNSKKERSVIADYMDFEDFTDQIGRVSEAGFVRLRTLSLAYTVPAKMERFRLDISETPEGPRDAL